MIRVTVPLTAGRTATVEGHSMTDLVAGLAALGYTNPRPLSREEVRRLDLSLAQSRSAIGMEDLDCGIGGADYMDPDPVGQVYDSE
jgi:hypothetical protein